MSHETLPARLEPAHGTMLELGKYTVREISKPNWSAEVRARCKGTVTGLDRIWLWKLARIRWDHDTYPYLPGMEPDYEVVTGIKSEDLGLIAEEEASTRYTLPR